MYRTHTCGELRLAQAGQEITLAGWIQTVRKFGSITFADLRDRYGITQLLFGEELNPQLDQQPLGREFVIQVKGLVAERSNKNPNLPTGISRSKLIHLRSLINQLPHHLPSRMIQMVVMTCA
ncbi:OB-fold nucleic acid binding domain-containing protein [Paraflavitalea speifideaquila]|uniref:OB-fold nucleic acid binding domain-containing protein n=1 Tax=Paraflavitalea speifideaquila TaxID=3076558 RepID=UPI0028E1A1C0|nr:OB-fold nucleic acid binding domain-containing protein [Paraflavitalea speifideiaquila]